MGNDDGELQDLLAMRSEVFENQKETQSVRSDITTLHAEVRAIGAKQTILMMKLLEFGFRIQYKKGALNRVAGAIKEMLFINGNFSNHSCDVTGSGSKLYFRDNLQTNIGETVTEGFQPFLRNSPAMRVQRPLDAQRGLAARRRVTTQGGSIIHVGTLRSPCG